MIQIPQDMTEVKVKIAQLEELGHKSNEKQVVFDAIQDNAQAILDEQLEGHYDSCTLDNDKITIYETPEKPIGSVKSQGASFEEDFRKNANNMFIYLQQEISKVINQR
ncbi:Hypothetical protein ADU72_0765 [Pediococcus damnosus]|uniref:Uncharacterized protein n=1 Tax=Pediococcus damnosus TaxID=51663 RepID=A0A0R2HBT8_9LACO|nr:hypothetical protein [Pediococcus damnosus]AMV63384.1 Hypothetical protein ADU70_1918 [Pediococcus damnosus]AMV66710.1 Hypothetical protein ADU72_0765 [Pediococcus damnosus]AMV69921.1 Hypothetical protein ADU73_1529 [Pediococcus damnosus]KJU74283.1 hypothetical protein AH70_07450 [Pediococcus damnosus LMG 28219]KRN49758.1 hypothetical protein IV84_GL001443 [Pediococcus damnosus]